MASALLDPSQEVGLPFLPIHERQSEIETALPEVIIHATSVLQCIDFDELMEPLNSILLSPGEILVRLSVSLIKSL